MSEWHVYIDGASLGNPGKSGAGLVAFDTAGNELWHEGVHLGEMTNNMAEYEALVHAVRRARDSGDVSLFVYTDSQLVANQWNGIYKVKNKRLLAYLMEAKALARNLTSVRVQYIPRERNRVADGIAKRAAEQEQALP
jgi:ribonuclease HI